MEQLRVTHHPIGHSIFVAGAFLLIIGLTIIAPINSSSTSAFGVSDIINLSNKAREQLGKNELRTNSTLMNAAQMKAEDMVKFHYFAHTAPDGTVAWDYLKKVSYLYKTAGENLAITNEDATAVINGWLNSPAHRENMLSDEFTDLGIGMSKYGDYQGHQDTYVIVAFYGTHSASQNLMAPTAPAGISSTLKPKYINIPPTAIIISAVCLTITGIVFEIRHIKRLNKSRELA